MHHNSTTCRFSALLPSAPIRRRTYLGEVSTRNLQSGEFASSGFEGSHLVIFARSVIFGRSHTSADSEAESWLWSPDNRSRYFIVSGLDWFSESGDAASALFSDGVWTAVPTQVVELSLGTETEEDESRWSAALSFLAGAVACVTVPLLESSFPAQACGVRLK